MEERDIIILVGTHEHEGCKVPIFKATIFFLVWNKGNDTGKGHGGIMVLIHERWCDIVKFKKEDIHKQYIWLQILGN